MAEQPFQSLVILLEHAGDTVMREEMRQKLGPQGVFIEFDSSLKTITIFKKDIDQPIPNGKICTGSKDMSRLVVM